MPDGVDEINGFSVRERERQREELTYGGVESCWGSVAIFSPEVSQR